MYIYGEQPTLQTMTRFLLLPLALLLSVSLAAQNMIPPINLPGKVTPAAGTMQPAGKGVATLTTPIDFNFSLKSSNGVRHKESAEVKALKEAKGKIRMGLQPMTSEYELTNGFEGTTAPIKTGVTKTANIQVGANFAGFNDANAWPNDNDIAVSNNGTVISVCNSHIDMYQSNGTQLYSQSFTSFFGNNPDLAGLIFDPKIVYDDELDRFFLVALVGNTAATSTVIVAASTGADPSQSGWNYFYFKYNTIDNTGSWFDYPTIGINSSKLFISGNTYLDNGNNAGNVMLAYSKADLISTNGTGNFSYWLDLTDNSSNLGFTIHPASYGAAGNYGPNALFVSTFAGSGSIFQAWVYDNANNSFTGYALTSPQYQLGSNAGQLNQGNNLDVGDCRVKGAVYVFDSTTQVGVLHFVFISVYNGSGTRNGVIKADITLDANNTTVNGSAFGISDGDLAHPAIAFLGNNSSNRDVVVAANFSTSTGFPGSTVFSVDANYQQSQYITLQSGLGAINDQSQGDTKIRWGDYMGVARKKNTGDGSDPVAWVASSYGLQNGAGGTWISEVTASSISLSVEDEDVKTIDQVELYPNPSANETTLSFSLSEASVTTVKIYDITGAGIDQLLYKDRLPNGDHKIRLSTADLPNAIYLLEVTTESGQRFTQKISVQH